MSIFEIGKGFITRYYKIVLIKIKECGILVWHASVESFLNVSEESFVLPQTKNNCLGYSEISVVGFRNSSLISLCLLA